MVIKYTGLATNQRNARNVNRIAVYVLLLVIMIAFPEYRNFRIYILLSMFKDGFQNRINLVLPFLSFFVFDDASKASAIALHLIESSIWILHWRPIFYLSIFRIEIYLFYASLNHPFFCLKSRIAFQLGHFVSNMHNTMNKRWPEISLYDSQLWFSNIFRSNHRLQVNQFV